MTTSHDATQTPRLTAEELCVWAAKAEAGATVVCHRGLLAFDRITLADAAARPDDVAGLVMVDTVTQLIREVASPEAVAQWDVHNRRSVPEAPEAVMLMDAFAKIDALPPLREMPAAVMQSNKPWMRPWDPKELETENGVTFAEWQASENLLAAALGTELVTATDSGHAIYAFFPPLVIDAIKEVVEAVRSGAARVPQ